VGHTPARDQFIMRPFLPFLTIVAGVAVLAGVPGCGLPDVIGARRLAREGNTRYLKGDYRGAIESYLEAQKIDPETPNLYLNLGYSYFSIFRPDERGDHGIRYAVDAIDAFEKHLERNPKDQAARVFEAKILLKAAPFDKAIADRALKVFLGLLEKDPGDVEARQYLISLFIDCQRYDDAVAFFGPQLEKHPGDTDAMKVLAVIAERCKRTRDAVSWYLRRAEVAPRPERKAELLYEVGTYIWGLLHYHPERVSGGDAQALIEQGLEATRQAAALKKDYAEAMVFTNLLLLKRVDHDTTEEAKYQDQVAALALRKAAERILYRRKHPNAPDADAGPDAGAGTPGPDDGSGHV
jgi:tetratricopeptide (TPR) repeat protein